MNKKKTRICKVIITAVILSILNGTLYSSPYELSPVTDGILAGSGVALLGTAFYTEKNISPLTDDKISELSKHDINRFDRSAADNWSPKAGKWSDRVITPMMISPLTFLIADETRSDFVTIGVMYAESLLITQGLNGTVKNTVKRKRPYAYNPQVSASVKKEKNTVLSFYSGHTVHAFNSAVFVSTVFSDYYPGSSWKYGVWGTTLSAASLTGYLRYRAGMHYPSDIITGAVIGSVTGWMIPMLHRRGGVSISIQMYPGAEKTAAVILNF